MPIKVVSLDVDGTLVKPTFIDYFWNYTIPKLYAEKNNLSFEEAKQIVFSKYGEIGENDIRWYIPQFWIDVLGLNKSLHEVLELTKPKLEFYDEAKDVLYRLSSKYRVIISSNLPIEIAKFELSEIIDKIERVFSAITHFNLLRKTQEFYRQVINFLGVEPSEIAHVGDNENYDFKVPRELGIHAFHLDRDGRKRGEFIVRNLLEFERKLYALDTQ